MTHMYLRHSIKLDLSQVESYLRNVSGAEVCQPRYNAGIDGVAANDGSKQHEHDAG